MRQTFKGTVNSKSDKGESTACSKLQKKKEQQNKVSQVPYFNKDLMAQPSLRARVALDMGVSACQVGFSMFGETECRNARVTLHICKM